MKGANPDQPRERRWGIVRLVLGFLQVFGASLGAGLLFQVGVTRLTLLVIVLTGLCTTARVLLFGGRPVHSTSAPRRRS